MDLVLKINDKCNFACDFCSSNQIALTHDDLDINLVKKFLLEHRDTRNIIINGGDPLLVSPDYYWELLRFREEHRLDFFLSLTTNLLEFWKHPEDWVALFKDERVGVCTSFQYGTGRKLATGEVYTEEFFLKVMDKYYKAIGEIPNFICVINKENEKTALQTVQLAKVLNTHCKINGALRSGRTTEPYPYHKMVKIYLDIIEAGLGDYEDNNKLLRTAWVDKLTECPYNSKCQESIRTMSPDGTIMTCPAVADDILKGVPEYFKEEGILPYKYSAITENCYTCKMFNICNSCHKRIIDIVDSGNQKAHCAGMKKLEKRLEKIFGAK